MNIVQEAKSLAIKEIEKFGIPSKPEAEFLKKKALELARKLNADETIVLVGVYLMDVKLGEALKKEKGQEHVKMGVEATKRFLKKFDLDKKIKKKIINCVEAHHKQVPFICKEAEICSNVDCYRFLHPRMFLTILANLTKIIGFSKTLDTLDQKLDEKYNILSLDVCKKELEKYYFLLKKLIKSARKADL